MRLFAVAGTPILHSKSPFIFKDLFKANSIDAGYTRIGPETPEELFFLAECLGLEGFNVTSPFKESIFSRVEEWDDQARMIGGVNAVLLKDGKKKGFNTDADGVSLTLQDRGIKIAGKKALVIGAGGAGRAAALALKKLGGGVVILNRTVDKAKDLAALFACHASGLESLGLHLQDASLVINTIPDAHVYLKDIPLGKKPVFFDAIYHARTLETICRQAGAEYIPGEEWLMNQAYRSFEIFTGKKLESRDLDARNLRRINSLGGERNVSLIGFMGSGKTTAGRILAQKLGFSFLDTDSEIEKKEGMTVNDIFRRKGEASFREKEREVIARLDGEKNTVVACGGGAILDEENRKVLRRNSIVIWLFSTPEESVRRLMNEERPLLGKDDPVERAKRIFQERKEKYFSAAHLILSSHKDAKEVAGKAHEEIRRMS